MRSVCIIAVCVGLAVTVFFILPATMQKYTVVEDSMAPSVQQSDWIYISKIIYRFVSPQRGDVLVFWPPQPEWGVLFIKRIIALPGESVEVRDGRVQVNNIALDEPYVSESAKYVFPRLDVPPDSYFVLGDNRNNSVDSHEGWTLPRQNVVGKAWFIYWPPSRWQLVRN